MTDDDDLINRLRRIAADFDPPPDAVVDNARAGFSMRRIDDEIATLLMDSAVESELVRGTAQDVRLLSFQTAEILVELQAKPAGDQVSLRGLVTGASGHVTVETANRRWTAAIDAEGWFTVTDLPGGATRLRLRTPDGRSVTTSWTLL